MSDLMELARDELVQALLSLDQEDDERGWKTKAELMEETGFGKDKASRELQRLHKAGRLVCRWVARPNVTGGQQRVPAYKLKPKVPALPGQ